MKKVLFYGLVITVSSAVFISCAVSGSTDVQKVDLKIKKIVYYNPEIEPNVEEIKEPSYQAFFSSVTDHLSKRERMKMLRVESTMKYDTVNTMDLIEICEANASDAVVVPKIKYFKVGLGKYVFSNQVIVSMKMYDAQGNFLLESSYDTFKKHKRILGSTENSIKIGTEKAMELLLKEIRLKNFSTSETQQTKLLSAS